MNSKSILAVTRFQPLRMLAAAVVLVLSGCSSVFVTKPVGEKTHVLVPADWEGLWLIENDAARAEVIDADGGRLRLSGIEIKDGQPTLVSTTLYVRESAGVLFVSVQTPEVPPGQFLWAQVKRTADHLVVWSPDAKKFAQLVREGKLKGRVAESGDVYLELSSADEAALAQDTHGVLYEWRSPWIFRRLKE